MSALGNTIYGAGRGALTAMAGLPGDINQLITDNLGTLVNAQGLPTTKEIQDYLPAKPTSYEGKLAQKLGEFIPVNPTPIAKGAVTIAKPVGKAMGEQAYRMTEDMLQKQGMMPSIVAYHGTPHNIQGAFDISKVGTGEGAQAYGHGMYYAENPNVAETYKRAGSEMNVVFNKPLEELGISPNLATHSMFSSDPLNQGLGEIVKGLRNVALDYPDVPINKKLVKEHFDEYIRLLDDKYKDEAAQKTALQNLISKEGYPDINFGGNLYKVDIPDEYVPTMMEWAKPLGEQSAYVKKAIESLKKQVTPEMKAELGGDLNLLFGKNVTPSQFLNTWEIIHPESKVGIGEDLLNKAGVKGIRYPDNFSRIQQNWVVVSEKGGQNEFPTAKQAQSYINKYPNEKLQLIEPRKGTDNFVIFDPKEVKILEKNSKPVSRKDIIEEQINKLEPTITVQDRTIPVTLHPVEAKQGNKIEYVNTDKFENAFKKDETGYIGKGGTENAIGKRYQGVEEFLKTAPSMRASEVHVRPNGSVVFGDGRHRYAFLRDQGLDKIPISMDADSIKNAKKFGYID
jgi:hypothetical protein